MTERLTCDGNDAVARVAYPLSEVVAIYPITPASPMGESADTWAAKGRPNRWGDVPTVVEMQSEAGAAGALHGALQAGALATTFTASQGLLLMLPDMFKIAGELTPAVIHVAARTLATHALSIFGDHSDVMAARTTGWAMLSSASVQEAHDMAVIAHAATLESRVPFLHFMDGFRTSHELNTISPVDDAVLAAMVPDELVRAHRERALDPDAPVLRGSAQNPDAFFQAREASNPFHALVPTVVEAAFERFAELTGRRYAAVTYHGHPEADRVLVIMGSGTSAAVEASKRLAAEGQRTGVLQVRLYRPFPTADLVAALPPTVRSITVLDRTKEPGAVGEPLYTDVVTAIAEQLAVGAAPFTTMPRVTGCRYGLSSKEFTPAMAAAVIEEMTVPDRRPHTTVGIVDDVTHLSLAVDPERFGADGNEPPGTVNAVFYGLGSDGTVGANKSSVKIIGEAVGDHAQGYFVYDSKKSGAVTVSHLRFGPDPIEAPWLIDRAGFVACHQWGLLERMDVLALAAPGATFLVNCPFPPQTAWDHLPAEVQARILELGLRVFLVDAHRVAADAGLGGYVSTVLQTCFFDLAQLLPREKADAAIKAAITGLYGALGEAVLRPNFDAVDAALPAMVELDVAGRTVTGEPRPSAVPDDAPDFVRRVTAQLMEGRGDLLPVSAFPPDGTFPTGTARYEKRSIARELPVWDPDLCIDCGKCAIACPHAAIRTWSLTEAAAEGAPAFFEHKPAKDKGLAGLRYTVQVAPDDCTGCGLCVAVCPARSREVLRHKAIDMEPIPDDLGPGREAWEFALELPDPPITLQATSVRGSQLRTPLFEFSGACAGCGETPYLKLLTQLFGDRLVVANATGCSSIYGGNLPTTPWSTDTDGRGPAWANSLFEDNAEFGLGIRLGLDQRRANAERLVRAEAGTLGDVLVAGLLEADQSDEDGIADQRSRVEALRHVLADRVDDDAASLLTLAGDLVDRSVWIVGGDGWAYDIGFGGLDHVLATGANVNVLVLDTEGYSNTGGQASKATSRGAVAKFASGGRNVRKKDLGMLAAGYGTVYVAQVAMGGNDLQVVRALHEAESFPGPSLVLAYSHCIAHGIDMTEGFEHQKVAVKSGYWPLYRYDPRHALRGDHPFRIDSRAPTVPFVDFARTEARFAMLERANPAAAHHLFALAQHDIDERWNLYEQMGELERWSDEEVDE